jgi:chromate transporter
VVLNLALFFGYHLLWPQGFASEFDAPSALIAVGAAAALFKYKRSVMEVIFFCALTGLAFKLLS